MKIRALLFLPLLAFLVGCSHNQHRASAEAAFYQAQAESAQALRQPIVEMVARPGEAIRLEGVERFAVYAPADPRGDSIVQYRAEPNPWPGVLSNLAGVGLQAFGIHRVAGVISTALDSAGGNTTVGGNLGTTSVDQSRVDDSSVSVGRDLSVRGDEIRGDEIRGSCVGDGCRNASPGPFTDDNSRRIRQAGGDGGDP